MKIALLTTALFDQPRNGGERCTQRLIDALGALGHEVHVAGRGRGKPRGIGSASTLGPSEPPFRSLSRRQQLLVLLRAAWRGEASSLSRLGGAGPRSLALRWWQALRADCLIVDHLQAMVWLPPVQPDLLLMHNHESRVYQDQVSNSGWLRRAVLAREARLLRDEECRLLPRCRALAFLSAADQQQLCRQLGEGGEIPRNEVLPGYADPMILPARASPSRRFGAIGTWTWEPNRHGLQWLLNEVWPQLPMGSELVLAGTGLEDMALPAGVRSLGRIDAATQLYAESDIILVPALHGSGVQEKAIEAIASGRCVIATAHALRGLEPWLPPQVHTAQDANQFASLCAQAPLPDPELATRAAGRWAERRQSLYRERLRQLLEPPPVDDPASSGR